MKDFDPGNQWAEKPLSVRLTQIKRQWINLGPQQLLMLDNLILSAEYLQEQLAMKTDPAPKESSATHGSFAHRHSACPDPDSRCQHGDDMNCPALLNFATHCPDGQKCGAETTGCRTNKCQRFAVSETVAIGPACDSVVCLTPKGCALFGCKNAPPAEPSARAPRAAELGMIYSLLRGVPEAMESVIAPPLDGGRMAYWAAQVREAVRLATPSEAR